MHCRFFGGGVAEGGGQRDAVDEATKLPLPSGQPRGRHQQAHHRDMRTLGGGSCLVGRAAAAAGLAAAPPRRRRGSTRERGEEEDARGAHGTRGGLHKGVRRRRFTEHSRLAAGSSSTHSARAATQMVRCANLALGSNHPSQPQPITGTPTTTAAESFSDCRARVGTPLAKHPRRLARRRPRNFCGPPPAASAPHQLPRSSPVLSPGAPLSRRRRSPAARPAAPPASPRPSAPPEPPSGAASPPRGLRATPSLPRPRSPPTRRCGQRRRWAPSSSRTAPSRSGPHAHGQPVRYNAKRQHCAHGSASDYSLRERS